MVALSGWACPPLETVLMTEDLPGGGGTASRFLGLPSAGVEGPVLHQLARQMAGAFGSPASLADVSQQPDVPAADQQAFEGSLRPELVGAGSQLSAAPCWASSARWGTT